MAKVRFIRAEKSVENLSWLKVLKESKLLKYSENETHIIFGRWETNKTELKKYL